MTGQVAAAASHSRPGHPSPSPPQKHTAPTPASPVTGPHFLVPPPAPQAFIPLVPPPPAPPAHPTCSEGGNMAATSSLALLRKKVSMAAQDVRRSAYVSVPRATWGRRVGGGWGEMRGEGGLPSPPGTCGITCLAMLGPACTTTRTTMHNGVPASLPGPLRACPCPAPSPGPPARGTCQTHPVMVR